MKRLKRSEQPTEQPTKLRRAVSAFKDNIGLIGFLTIAGGTVGYCDHYEFSQHGRYESRSEQLAEEAMKKDASEQQVMDALTHLSFGRKNAEDLLTKIDDIANAGPLRGFHPEQPHQGLWLLVMDYQRGYDEFNHLPCLFVGLVPGGHLGSAPDSQRKIADLYYAGKLKGLIEKHRKEKEIASSAN